MRLKHAYNLTVAQFEQMCARGCHICGVKTNLRRRFNVDHDHRTGRVRGVLCDRCNLVLGKIQDSPELLAKMINYLMEAQAQ